MNNSFLIPLISLAAGLVLLVIYLLWRVAPAPSMIRARGESHFPIVSGANLDRTRKEFPRDFAGERNLVVIAFERWHQRDVDTWIPAALDLETACQGFVYYELPTIRNMPVLSRTFINEGMRAGIPDRTARERTVTLYLDKMRFRTALGIPDERSIRLFLVDREGRIFWSESGPWTPEKGEGLTEAVQDEDPEVFHV